MTEYVMPRDEYKMLKVSALVVDPTTQRELRPEWVKELAENWDDSLYEPIEVVPMTGKKRGYKVTRGQHRAFAAQERCIEYILCRIRKERTNRQVAERVIGEKSKRFTRADRFKVVSDNMADSPEASVRRICEVNNLIIGRKGHIRSVTRLMEAYGRTGEDFKYVAAVLAEYVEYGIKIESALIHAVSVIISLGVAEIEATRLVDVREEYARIYNAAKRKCIGVTMASAPQHLTEGLARALPSGLVV